MQTWKLKEQIRRATHTSTVSLGRFQQDYTNDFAITGLPW